MPRISLEACSRKFSIFLKHGFLVPANLAGNTGLPVVIYSIAIAERATLEENVSQKTKKAGTVSHGKSTYIFLQDGNL